MMIKQSFILLTSIWIVSGQRPTFAGTKPIGFPELANKTSDGLESRFGPDSSLVLPIEAKGDRDLVERISKMPVDKQPFWYINWKALEENRRNPQTYQPKQSPFSEGNLSPNSQSNNGAIQNANTGTRQNRQLNQRRRFNSA